MIEPTLQEIAVSVAAGLILAGITYLLKRWRNAVRSLRRLQRIAGDESHLLVYLSSGGTCRDPMAVVITRALIDERYPLAGKTVRVEGGALGPETMNHASFAARHAIEEIYGKDLLADYVPGEVTKEDLDEADLILVMSQDLKNDKKLPGERSYVFKEFLGKSGDVDVRDPWPDGRDETTLARYRSTAEEIKEILEADGNIRKVLQALDVSPELLT